MILLMLKSWWVDGRNYLVVCVNVNLKIGFSWMFKYCVNVVLVLFLRTDADASSSR